MAPFPDLSDEDSARLVRAAIAHSGQTLADVSGLTGIKQATLRNYTSRARPTYATAETRLKIGRACEVPDWFMAGGFINPPSTGGDLRATVRRLEHRLQTIEQWRAVVELEAMSQTGASSSVDPPAQGGPQP